MPSSPCTADEVGEARMIFELAMALDADDDSNDDSVTDVLTLAAVEPLQRTVTFTVLPQTHNFVIARESSLKSG